MTQPTLTAEQRIGVLDRLGSEVSSDLVGLKDRLPDISGALICTADGYNVCAVGVARRHVGRLASLVSSIAALGDAVCTTVTETDQSLKGQLVLMADHLTVCVVHLPTRDLDDLVLLIVAENATGGSVLAAARPVADLVRAKLAAQGFA